MTRWPSRTSLPLAASSRQIEDLPEGYHDISIATVPWKVGEAILLAG
jgi:hypothetical protein